jgi:hypothetical protein
MMKTKYLVKIDTAGDKQPITRDALETLIVGAIPTSIDVEVRVLVIYDLPTEVSDELEIPERVKQMDGFEARCAAESILHEDKVDILTLQEIITEFGDD